MVRGEIRQRQIWIEGVAIIQELTVVKFDRYDFLIIPPLKI